ncbi:MAG TPA: DUF4249 domain-containing protein [Ferruginibacter sp.]|nr:DUF4249 domain-containing protein [Ferruginibacter sp.]HMP22232.1 DUF4249 domain-containing protein [Ferruginibacter sp.]
MKIKSIYILIAAAVVLYSCEKVVQVDLNKATPQMVIQGNITNEAGPYTVSITQSVPFDNDNVYPPVNGALVEITDITADTTDVLTQTAPGLYSTSTIAGIEGHSYALKVQALGKEYTATTVMPAVVPFDSLTFYTNSFFGITLTNPVPNYQDPAGVPNYYLFRQYINDKAQRGLFVFEDRLSDGRYIATQLFNDSSYIQPGDTVEVEMWCIEKNIFNYFNQIIESQGRGNTGPVAAPTNPVSNISGSAFGYFSAHPVQRRKSVFK